MRNPTLLVLCVLFGLVAGGTAFLLAVLPSKALPEGPLLPPAQYVGGEACAECHRREYDQWVGSHHDKAMEEATAETVLGDFDDATFVHNGVTSRFFKRDAKFFVRTDGPDGKLRDYPIAYTFGFTPLQQYLVAFPGGRYQALSICWDARPAKDGGQRWFHLYPKEQIPHDDVLHWTRPSQNWNYMCAECHSTDLRKGYDLEKKAYATTWEEIDVSCEACHGPGSRHVDWARIESESERERTGRDRGLVVRLKDPHASVWIMNEETGNAKRQQPLASDVVIETCARCHSRRRPITENYTFGRPLLDTHRLSLLSERLYYSNGQIRDEVYVHGSFLQSKMYHHGVTCTDCHDAHTTKVKAQTNALCSQCHSPAKYDARSHHHHDPEYQGKSCIGCHMPTRDYMVVDPRRDHSIRIPRPDLAAKVGTVSACHGCHEDKTTGWAAAAMDKWYGKTWRKPHYGDVLNAARLRQAGAAAALAKLAGNAEEPSIVRATALARLREFPGAAAVAAARAGLKSIHALVRVAAVELLIDAPVEIRKVTASALADEVLAVRIEAARALAGVPLDGLTSAQREAYERAHAELIASELVNGDLALSHMNLGNLHGRRGDHAEAQAAFKTALLVDPTFVQAWVNLADSYRGTGREDLAESALREALRVDSETAEARHALGLLLIRTGRRAEALEELRVSSVLAADRPRFAYVYGIALHDARETDRALAVLAAANRRHPADREILLALATINRDQGNRGQAILYARELVTRWPEVEGFRSLLRSLERRR